MREAHTSKVARHFIAGKTLAHLQRYVYWPNMQEEISKFIRGCKLYCTGKPKTRKEGFYMPFPVPTHPWEDISMDFFGGLPMSKHGHDYLYVVTDRFSKMCILMTCKKIVKAHEAVDIFFANVWVYFGLPKSIVFYRDSRFLGNFQTTLWDKMDTRLQRTTNFDSKIDGQTKVVNKNLVQLIKGYNRKYPRT